MFGDPFAYRQSQRDGRIASRHNETLSHRELICFTIIALPRPGQQAKREVVQRTKLSNSKHRLFYKNRIKGKFFLMTSEPTRLLCHPTKPSALTVKWHSFRNCLSVLSVSLKCHIFCPGRSLMVIDSPRFLFEKRRFQ